MASCNKLACLIQTIIKNPNAFIGSKKSLQKLIPIKIVSHGISEFKSDDCNAKYNTECNEFKRIENHILKLNEFRLIAYNINVTTINVTRNGNKIDIILE